ncbi:glycoside hydrolase family 2 TIM barrel-domain containing protein [Brachybacterium paraconglomeratum]|uniref:glycoside hydrolase family 2 TIM barrel-domain containing protein n=1 Tax=Brachybacterium paraconglomeratum TaxID=173362 RepID=UPI0037CB6C9F
MTGSGVAIRTAGSGTARRQLAHWSFRRDAESTAVQVRLPHDAMIGERRGPDSAGGADAGWFHGGRYEYESTWQAGSDDDSFVGLRFEGVQGDSVVHVNDIEVGRIHNGYTEVELPIRHAVRWGAENVVRVAVDTSAQPSSRWYSGAGLYRPVHLVHRPATRFADDGVRLRTLAIGESARVEVAFDLINPSRASLTVTVELWDATTRVAAATASGGANAVSFDVPHPHLWSAESPHRYQLLCRIEDETGTVLDERHERVGLRTIEVDAKHGLRVNGTEVLLRGACIHHDNGVLGAATHRSAEFRRIRLLKEAGFNAIRSAHNPMSRQLLDACDELGMYVLEEFADYWFVKKTAHDHAGKFLETWRTDAASLIEKDRNRPSVIMYAIGNEIPETATPAGVELAREITRHFHDADPDRPVTVAVNIFLNVLVTLGASPYASKKPADDAHTSMAGSTEANVMVNQIGRMMNLVSRLPRADRASREAFDVVDVAGYNYGLARYRQDLKAYPHRVILGTETLPGDVARAWRAVEAHPAVIGDFVWTGWEFLGEAGVGAWVPGKRAGLSKPYPYILHGGGMFDLIGQPDASLRLAQAAWGTLEAPAIAVRPVDRSGLPVVKSAWRSTDAVESWSWRGYEGRRAEIEVYSTDDEVELLLNGRSLGRRRTGRRRGYLARFAAPYEPGELVAVGYRDGEEASRSALRSAGRALSLQLIPETDTLVGDELAFLTIAIADASGTVEMLADDQVTLDVQGPAELIGFGSAAPATEESFISDTHTTYRGRALAVLRPTGTPGPVRVTARSVKHGEATIALTSSPAPL